MSSSIRRMIYKSGTSPTGKNSYSSSRSIKDEALGEQLAPLLGVRGVFEVEENEFMRDKFVQVGTFGLAGKRGISESWHLGETTIGTVWKPRIMMITMASVCLFSYRRSVSPSSAGSSSSESQQANTLDPDSVEGSKSLSLDTGSAHLIGVADEVKTCIPLEDVSFACEFVNPKGGSNDMMIQIRVTQVTGIVRTTIIRCKERRAYDDLMRCLEVALKSYRAAMTALREGVYNETMLDKPQFHLVMATLGTGKQEKVITRNICWNSELKIDHVDETCPLNIYIVGFSGILYKAILLPYQIKYAFKKTQNDQNVWVRADAIRGGGSNDALPQGSEKTMSLQIILPTLVQKGEKEDISDNGKIKNSGVGPNVQFYIRETYLVMCICLIVAISLVLPEWCFTRENFLAFLTIPIVTLMFFIRGQQNHKSLTTKEREDGTKETKKQPLEGETTLSFSIAASSARMGLEKTAMYYKESEQEYMTRISPAKKQSALAAAQALGSSTRRLTSSDPSQGVDALIATLQGASDEEWRDEDCPQKWFDATDGNRKDALRQWKESLQWRRDNDIDNILSKPQPHFFTIKKLFPHCWMGLDNNGHLVTLERFGNVKKNVTDLKNAGITPEIFAEHCVFLNEYWIQNRVTPTGRLYKIIDLKGFGVSQLSSFVINFFQPMNHAMQQYPELIIKVHIINAPTSFRFAWKIVTPFLAKKTTEKIQMLAGNEKTIADALTQNCPKEILAPEYGGTNTKELIDYDLEIPPANFIRQINANKGVEAKDDWAPLPKRSNNQNNNNNMNVTHDGIPIASVVDDVASENSNKQELQLLMGDWSPVASESDSMDPILELQGLNWVKRKAVGMLLPSQSIQINGDEVRITTKMGPVKVQAGGTINGPPTQTVAEDKSVDTVVVRISDPPHNFKGKVSSKCLELAFSLANGDKRIVHHGIATNDRNRKYMSINYTRVKDNKQEFVTLVTKRDTSSQQQ